MDIMDLKLGLIRIRLARRQRHDGSGNRPESGKKIGMSRIDDIIGAEEADKYRDILSRYRADEEDWVTIKGTHVLIDENGVAQSGGKLKGMVFANAKSVKSKSAKKGGSAGGKEGAKPPAKKGLPALREKAADSIQKCADIRKDLGFAKKLDWMNKDELGAEKAKADAQVKKLKSSAKRADNAVKKAQKEADEALGGMTREEFNKALEEKKEERNDAFKKFIAADTGSEMKKAMEEYERIDGEYQKLTETAKKIDKIGSLQDKARAKAAEVERAEEYADAVGRRQSGELGNSQTLMQAYKAAMDERDKAVLKAFGSASECETSQQATDYLRAKGYFRKTGSMSDDDRVDITKMKPEHAVAYAARVETFMDDYPFLKGRMEGIDCHNFEEDAKSKHRDYSTYLGYANGTRICFPEGYYGDQKNVSSDKYKGNIKSSYERTVEKGFHPQGTDYVSVVDHELTHACAKVVQSAAMSKGIMFPEGRIENEVMRRVQMKLYGSYDKKKEGEVRKAVSGYAWRNKGITDFGEVKEYGRNTEFLAEAMAEARCSKNPGDIAKAAREAFEEIMKEAGLI